MAPISAAALSRKTEPAQPVTVSESFMHELSIALRIVETLEEELADEVDDLIVTTVTIRVGTLTGLVPEALHFSWDLAVDKTRLHGSKLQIEQASVVGFCPQCRLDRTITNLQSFRCPVCLTPIEKITGGNELEIMTLEVQDNVPA